MHHGGWMRLLSLRMPGSLLLQLLLLLFSCEIHATLERGTFVSREEYYRRINADNTNEERLYLENCAQSSDTGHCSLAIDNQIIQEWTQCSSTASETQPWWNAFLETPAYVSKVVIHTAPLPDAAMQSALNQFIIYAGGTACYRHNAAASFSSRSFPCDVFTDFIELSSDRKDAVMSLCEVEVYGKALAFQELENGAAEIALNYCSSSVDWQLNICKHAFDRNFAVFNGEHGKKCLDIPSDKSAEEAWMRAYFKESALVKHVKLFNRMDKCCKNSLNHFTLHINYYKCLDHNDANPFVTKIFNCTRFGQSRASGLGTRCGPTSVPIAGFRLLNIAASERATKMCKRLNKLYFGLQNGRLCYCGNKFGRYGEAKEPKACDKRCIYSKSKRCGGHYQNSVYEIIL
uniref:WSC domain-containing protein n=1 Tax=Macrostomum lignano TaxID=282301 RepID=A0A1I8JJQ1_9PLAT